MMNGGSTIGVPNAPIALPDIPQGTCTKAQPTGEGCSRVAATRGGWSGIVFKRTLVHGARIGT